MAEIEAALCLTPMPLNCTSPRKHIDWVIWTCAIQGVESVRATTEDARFPEGTHRAFGRWGGYLFSWREANGIFATAFGTYTLHAQP